MRALEKIALAGMHCIDPERAHGVAVQSLKMGLGFGQGPIRSPRLSTTLAGMDLANPVGLAAGFDKNAEVVGPLAKAGFGFIEVGAATPRPQPGNPKPRLFRLTEDQAAINRFGFNNEGMDVIAERLASRVVGIPVGLNLGANKDSEDRAQDFATVLRRCGPHVDFATVNVSSPNTEKLRDLQGRAALSALLAGVMGACGELRNPIPVFLKIAPDLDDDALVEIAEVAVEAGLAGIIATNTTLSRDGLTSPHKGEAGGLSGQPVFEKSTRVLARLSELLDGAMPLVGVGGVGSAEQAYAKIRAGASAVQIYTAMVYGGLSLAGDIAQGLDALLERDGFNSVTEAVGTGRSEWL